MRVASSMPRHVARGIIVSTSDCGSGVRHLRADLAGFLRDDDRGAAGTREDVATRFRLSQLARGAVRRAAGRRARRRSRTRRGRSTSSTTAKRRRRVRQRRLQRHRRVVEHLVDEERDRQGTAARRRYSDATIGATKTADEYEPDEESLASRLAQDEERQQARRQQCRRPRRARETARPTPNATAKNRPFCRLLGIIGG